MKPLDFNMDCVALLTLFLRIFTGNHVRTGTLSITLATATFMEDVDFCEFRPKRMTPPCIPLK